jgi:hypothetical protein
MRAPCRCPQRFHQGFRVGKFPKNALKSDFVKKFTNELAWDLGTD